MGLLYLKLLKVWAKNLDHYGQILAASIEHNKANIY